MQSRYGKYKFKSHSRAELLKFLVSGYGLPRYHGRKLVGVSLRDRLIGNQGGTTEIDFRP